MMTAKQIIITCMLFHNNIQNIRLAIPVFFRFTDVAEFMIGITILYRWRMLQ